MHSGVLEHLAWFGEGADTDKDTTIMQMKSGTHRLRIRAVLSARGRDLAFFGGALQAATSYSSRLLERHRPKRTKSRMCLKSQF